MGTDLVRMENRLAAKEVKISRRSRSPENYCWLWQRLKMHSGLAQAPCPLAQSVIRISFQNPDFIMLLPH